MVVSKYGERSEREQRGYLNEGIFVCQDAEHPPSRLPIAVDCLAFVLDYLDIAIGIEHLLGTLALYSSIRASESVSLNKEEACATSTTHKA